MSYNPRVDLALRHPEWEIREVPMQGLTDFAVHLSRRVALLDAVSPPAAQRSALALLVAQLDLGVEDWPVQAGLPRAHRDGRAWELAARRLIPDDALTALYGSDIGVDAAAQELDVTSEMLRARIHGVAVLEQDRDDREAAAYGQPAPEVVKRRRRGRDWTSLRIRTTAVAGGGVALAMLTACTPTHAPAAGQTPVAIAARIGCTHLQPADTEELFVRALETCQLDGQTVRIYTFASKDNADQWVQAASGFGPVKRVTNTIVVNTDSSTVRAAIDAKLS